LVADVVIAPQVVFETGNDDDIGKCVFLSRVIKLNDQCSGSGGVVGTGKEVKFAD